MYVFPLQLLIFDEMDEGTIFQLHVYKIVYSIQRSKVDDVSLQNLSELSLFSRMIIVKFYYLDKAFGRVFEDLCADVKEWYLVAVFIYKLQMLPPFKKKSFWRMKYL